MHGTDFSIHTCVQSQHASDLPRRASDPERPLGFSNLLYVSTLKLLVLVIKLKLLMNKTETQHWDKISTKLSCVL